MVAYAVREAAIRIARNEQQPGDWDLVRDAGCICLHCLSQEESTWPVAYTSDGTLIVPGLKVLDYNWHETVVSDREPHWANGIDDTLIPWFWTANGGMFDGSRMKAI